ncbi:MAG: CPBP family intramembrane metalloprotease, partial [Planctomycetes bacterium]|nr:CPBP family intramembrane metalloprotease [Planctomycetota bacterium]
GAAGRGAGLAGIAAKDLRLLGRDRTFLASTLVAPLAMLGIQLYMNPEFFDRAFVDPRHIGALAFGLAAYVLLFSATTVLSAEGPALWLLYTVPHRLDRLLIRKAAMWSGFALIYALCVLGYGAWVRGVDRGLAVAALLACAGIPLYALIAGALGVFGCDPQETEVRHRLRADYIYLGMLLESLYITAFYSPGFWSRLGLLVLLTALALALWQKVAQRLPYLLDPVAQPPAALSLADGLIAALLFFVFQGLFALTAISGFELAPGPALLFAFAAAGATAFLSVLFVLWRHGVVGIAGSLGLGPGAGWGRTFATGAAWSIPAVIAGGTYIWLTVHWPWLAAQAAAARQAGAGFGDLLGEIRPWLVGVIVIAAPLCEEAIFRGMIFKGLRASFGLGASVLLSAAIFAVVHPPLSVAPVFVLGMCTALAFERARSLAAPIVVHALYNAVVVWLQG